MALLPTTHRIGRWEREHCKTDTPLGRRAKLTGRVVAPRLTAGDKQLIRDSYKRHRQLGKSLKSIYEDALKLTWGCKPTKNSEGFFFYYHPQGRPYPTFRQYQYELFKGIGSEQIRIDKRGKEYVRNKTAASRGRFTEHTANLMERVEADGDWSSAHPIGLDKSPLPRIVTVRLIDSLSGCHIGVGFSEGAERAEAYRSAEFAAAIGLRRYSGLFGLDPGEFETPSPGLIQVSITDRGSGATQQVGDPAPIRELATAYSGQSKSLVESHHPRTSQDREAPSHMVSNLGPVQMAAQEVMRAIAHNYESDASGRMTPEMLAANVAATPISIWHYMETRGRTAAGRISFEAAVRRFLQRKNFSITRRGVTLEHFRFGSPDFDVQKHLRRDGVASVTGYILPMCVRHVWVESTVGLIQLDAQLPFADSDSQLYLSLTELQHHAERTRASQTAQRDQRQAARAYAKQHFLEQTGNEFDRSSRRAGAARLGNHRSKTRADGDFS
ncbi:hypothetical protein [Spectribacter hydrogenoxidans]|uniref:Uncharacterized protein n=1 Tax=Spectribacter hydrogenoxidans TaxID=3075608 RepID=A0ABU3C003_9GAMM|nr:hypothetical protein [Salinisphaera sp. W335]MDT0634870.1 hypothetical protein [Salinisphaera sp. W335]